MTMMNPGTPVRDVEAKTMRLHNCMMRTCHTIAAAALLLLGCEGPPAVDTSLTEAKVSGLVTVKGVPATGGSITFNPSNHLRKVASKTAEIGKDGRYTVTTYTGGNQVSFDGEVAAKNMGVGLVKEFCDVQSGENEANFDLLGEGGKKNPFPIESKAKKGRGRGR